MDPTLLAVVIVAFALVFDLSNGWNDAANAIATSVSTRVLRPVTALVLSAILNFVGALYSSEVAKTVGRDIADASLLHGETFLAAVITAPIWITFCTWRGLPVSCSHSLMGGLIGSVLATAGGAALRAAGIKKILFGVFVPPVAGFACGYLLVGLLYLVCRNWRPATVWWLFGKLQVLRAAALGVARLTASPSPPVHRRPRRRLLRLPDHDLHGRLAAERRLRAYDDPLTTRCPA